MAKPSICVVGLIASIVSMAFHMPGVDAFDIDEFLEHATNKELAEFLPGYTVDADGNLVAEVSHPEARGLADSFPSIDDLPPFDPFDSEEPSNLENVINVGDFFEGGL